MAKNIPGGGTVTRGFPPILLGGGDVADPSWKEEYVADLTTLGTASYAHDADPTINGVEWLSETNPDESGGVAGTVTSDSNGLTILSDGESADDIITGITCPTFSFKLGGAGGAIPDLSNLDTIAVQVLVSELSTRNNTFEGYGTVLYTPGAKLSAVTKLLYHKNWFLEAGVLRWGCGGVSGANSGNGGPSAGGVVDVDNASGIEDARTIVMETIFNFNGQTATLGHVVSASTELAPYTPFTQNRMVVAGDVLSTTTGTLGVPTWSFQASAARFGIGAFTADNNTTDDFSVRFTRVRVLRLGGSGGGAV